MSEALRKRLGGRIQERGVEAASEPDPRAGRRVVETVRGAGEARRSSVWARLGLETKGLTDLVSKEDPREGDEVEVGRLDEMRDIEGQDIGAEVMKEDLRTVEGQDVGLALDEEFGTRTNDERNVVAEQIAAGNGDGENGLADPSGHGRKLVKYDDLETLPEREVISSPQMRDVVDKNAGIDDSRPEALIIIGINHKLPYKRRGTKKFYQSQLYNLLEALNRAKD